MKFSALASLSLLLVLTAKLSLFSQEVSYSQSELAILEEFRYQEAESRKAQVKPAHYREEKIEQIGTDVAFSKLLFYKQIRIKNKTVKELILFDALENKSERYLFQNNQNYRLSKQQIVNENDLTLSQFRPHKTKGQVIDNLEDNLGVDSLNSLGKIEVKVRERFSGLYSITFYLGEGRDKIILASLGIKKLLLDKPYVSEFYFFKNGLVFVPIISYKYLKGNEFVFKKKIVPINLEARLRQPNLRLFRVSSEVDFRLNLEQAGTIFLSEVYFNFLGQEISRIDYQLDGKRQEVKPIYSSLYEIVKN